MENGIRAMCTLNVPAGATRITQLIVCADDALYIANPDGSTFKLPGTFLPGDPVQAAAARHFAYFVDGTATVIVIDVTAGAGATGEVFVPTGGLPGAPRLIAFHMDCMVLAGFDGDEENYALSRIAHHDDFDLSKADDGAPVEGSASLAHSVGQPIKALIPGRDRQLVFACDHSLWRMLGHPRQGGSVTQVSDQVGIAGANAWASDPAGNVYFVDTSGFYAMSPGGGPLDLSSTKVRKYFQQIDRSTARVTCVWDQRWLGCHIFVTGPNPPPYEGTPENVHLFYDARRKGFWRMQLPLAMDPVCAVGFDGDSADRRVVMLGARDGFIRFFDEAAVDDDGVAIVSRIVLGPIAPAGAIRQARCTGLDLVLGELPSTQPQFTEADNWHLDWSMRGGDSAYLAAFDPSETRSGSFDTIGRQRPQGFKLGASGFALELSNSTRGKFWSLDAAAARFVAAGKQR